MTELLFVKDLHLRPNNVKQPVGRTELYYDQIKNKLEQINSYAFEHGIKYLLCAGDIFDIKARSRYTFDGLMYLDSLITKTLKDVHLVTIAGNHDMPSSARIQLESSVYAYFARNGRFVDVSNKPLDLPGVVSIYGVPYNPDINSLRQELEVINSQMDALVINILMVHEHLLPRAENIYASFLTYDEILSLVPNARVICAGHLHKGFPAFRMNKRYILNPWSFNRLARDHYVLDQTHIPEFCHITINNFEVDVKTIPLKVQPFDVTFIQEQLHIERAYQDSISDFITKIEDFRGIDEALENTPAEIRDKIGHYLDLAEAELKNRKD